MITSALTSSSFPDFEELLEELETGTRRDPTGRPVATTLKNSPGKYPTPEAPLKEPQLDTTNPSPLVVVGGRGRAGQRGRMVNRAQNTDPNPPEAIFEFHEGRECVVEGRVVEAGSGEGAMALKHPSGPFVFPEEELSQGGRDVNENVGAMSEAASA